MQQNINSSILAAGLTDTGCVREHNEDAFYADTDTGLFVVTDGVGGHAAGDIASQMVIDEFPELIAQRMSNQSASNGRRSTSPRTLMADCLAKISRHVYDAGKDRVDRKAMGTTTVAAWIVGRYVHLVNMGDSRAYLLRRGLLRQLTNDHSIVGYLLRHGEITPREADDHPAKGRLTRYVGMEAEVDPETHGLKLQSADRLLLCTDGLWGGVSDADIQSIMSDQDDPDAICRALIDAGKRAGGPDNLTALVIMIGGAKANHCNRGCVGNFRNERSHAKARRRKEEKTT